MDLSGFVGAAVVPGPLPSTRASKTTSLPPDFVVRIDYPDVILFEADAVGSLFYLVTHLFDAEPGFCVFVDAGVSPHPGLRAFIKKIGLTDQVCFVPTREAADDRVRALGAQWGSHSRIDRRRSVPQRGLQLPLRQAMGPSPSAARRSAAGTTKRRTRHLSESLCRVTNREGPPAKCGRKPRSRRTNRSGAASVHIASRDPTALPFR